MVQVITKKMSYCHY